ncbi:MAG: FAD-binding protein, partial [Chloroflexi bacterium]|nr:FAD-binding protein [Chloroflexota bacterium]
MNIQTSIRLSTLSKFHEQFGEQLQLQAPLARYTSARVGGMAEMLLTVTSAEELETAVSLAYKNRLPYFILGGGSNIMISEKGIRGLVIMNRAKQVTYRHTGASVICTVESGMNLSSLARQCMAKGLGGLEWAVSVPGTVGGAVVGNSGAHGSDMNATLRAATIWEPARGVRIYTNEELDYGYRNSILKQEQGRNVARRVVL